MQEHTNNTGQQQHSTSMDLGSLSPIMILHQLEGATSSSLVTTTVSRPHELDRHSKNQHNSPFPSPISSGSYNFSCNHAASKKKPRSPLVVADNRYSPSPTTPTRRAVMGPPLPPQFDKLDDSSFLETSVTPYNSTPHYSSSSSCRSVLSPLSVQAILGPFSSTEEAKRVHQEWRNPENRNSKAIRLKDPDKGLEKQGRDLARKYNSKMIEYWDFLDTYCDLTTKSGLAILDNYLHEKMNCSACLDQSPKSEGVSNMEGSIFEYAGTGDNVMVNNSNMGGKSLHAEDQSKSINAFVGSTLL